MHRGWLEHPVFGSEPFSKRDAWCWLIENAAFRSMRTDAGGKTITVERGQIAHAYRFLAAAWGWSLGATQRFLGRLETETMIRTASDTGRLIITICNYERYQVASVSADTPRDTPADTAPIRDRYATDTNKKEGKELKELDDDEEKARAREIVKGFLENRERLWPATSRLPANGLTMLADARQFVKAGITPEFFVELVTPRMDRMAEGNRSPPNSPGFFRDTISDALARLAESEKPLPIERPANGRPPQAPAEQPSGEAPPGGDRFLKRFGKGLGELPRADGDPVLPAASRT